MEDDDDENTTEVAESDGAALELERGTPCRCGGAYGRCAALDVRRYLTMALVARPKMPMMGRRFLKMSSTTA
jgi:hypothetical protein